MRILVASLLSAGLSACGGGGGGASNSPTISFAATQFTFTAATPAAANPADQVVTATVKNVKHGTLYLLVEVKDPDLISVSDFAVTGTKSGQATLSVIPSPAKLGMGTYTARVSVRACLDDQSCATGELQGSPQDLTVNYEVGSPVQQDTLMPGVIIAGSTGRLALRGSGFTGVTGVHFAGADATLVTVVNDTELRVDYPPMAAGPPSAVTLRKGSASADFAATLTVVDAIDLPETRLALPAMPGFTYIPVGLTFDAVHRALLVGMRAISDPPLSQDSPDHDAILRYRYTNGAWQAPTVHPLPRLRYLLLSPDSQTLLAATDDSIERLDASTLVSGGSSPKPSADCEFIRGLAYANDGNVIVATGFGCGSGATRLYLYSMKDGSYSYPRLAGSGESADNRFYAGMVGASGNGSVALVAEPLSGGGFPLKIYRASTGRWVDTPTLFTSYYAGDVTGNVWAPAINERGNRFVVPGIMDSSSSSTNEHIVLNADLEPSGIATVAEDTQGMFLNRSGAHAYVLRASQDNPPVCSVHAFDLTTAPSAPSGSYSEIQNDIFPIARSCLSGTLGALSPDDRTLFVAGAEGIDVIRLCECHTI